MMVQRRTEVVVHPGWRPQNIIDRKPTGCNKVNFFWGVLKPAPLYTRAYDRMRVPNLGNLGRGRK